MKLMVTVFSDFHRIFVQFVLFIVGASCINKVPDNEHQAPDNWPRAGEVEFRNVCMKYLTSASCVLNDISIKVPAGKKIGIVGRTGAGMLIGEILCKCIICSLFLCRQK